MRKLLKFMILLCVIPLFITGCQSHIDTNELEIQNLTANEVDDSFVYITKTGEKYHTVDCFYLKSCIGISLSDAIDNGYEPCKKCNPPKFR